MTDSAALLADEVLPRKPLRQWVLSLPFALRFLLATDAEALTQVLGIVYRNDLGPHSQEGPAHSHEWGDRRRDADPASDKPGSLTPYHHFPVPRFIAYGAPYPRLNSGLAVRSHRSEGRNRPVAAVVAPECGLIVG